MANPKLIARQGNLKLYFTKRTVNVFSEEEDTGFIEFPDGKRIFANINDVLSRGNWNIVGKI